MFSFNEVPKSACVCDVNNRQVEMVHKPELEEEQKSAAAAKAAEGQQIKCQVKHKEEQLLLRVAEIKIYPHVLWKYH
jgi:ferredoxin